MYGKKNLETVVEIMEVTPSKETYSSVELEVKFHCNFKKWKNDCLKRIL